jgi:HAD superfamily hydrolase (TIGR01493 family)
MKETPVPGLLSSASRVLLCQYGSPDFQPNTGNTMPAPKAILFDQFGTVFNMSGVPKEELKAYLAHTKKPKWEPLTLPESWKTIPAFPDSREAIEALRKKYKCCTLSNGPVAALTALAEYNGIEWDAIIPIETAKVYKPDHGAYYFACDYLKLQPNEIMMVTANKTFGDLEASATIAMIPQYIDRAKELPFMGAIHTLGDFAAMLANVYGE